MPGGVGTAAKILATPQGSLGSGVYVAYAARSSATKIKISLNKKSTKKGKVAWFVLD